MKLTLQTTLVAAAADRVITGLLVPYGEKGYPITHPEGIEITPGSLLAPLDPSQVVLNSDHDQTQPIGRALELTGIPAGVKAAFKIAPGPDGDRALEEAKKGTKRSLSVEIDNPVIKNGSLLAGIITGAALVKKPAFTSAVLAAKTKEETTMGKITAEDKAEIVDAVLAAINEAKEEPPAAAAENAVEAIEEIVDEAVKEEDSPALAAARAANRPQPSKRKVMTAHDLYETMARATRSQSVRAALADIIPSNLAGVLQPAYVGELWSGRAYERRIIPAFNHAEVKSKKIQGWRWKKRPAVGPWTGDKAEIPSAPIETESVEIEVSRIAGGHDIDRIFKDFGEAEFWEAYYTAMTESYARQSDAEVLAEIIKAAPAVTLGSVPTGVAPGMAAVLDGALSILANTNTVADHAFIAIDVYREMGLTRLQDSLAYLSAGLGIEEGKMAEFKLLPEASLTPGQVLVTTTPAATVHELGGGAPIRVEALDVGRGGIDAAVYGYLAVNIHDEGGLALVDTSTAP